MLPCGGNISQCRTEEDKGEMEGRFQCRRQKDVCGEVSSGSSCNDQSCINFTGEDLFHHDLTSKTPATRPALQQKNDWLKNATLDESDYKSELFAFV